MVTYNGTSDGKGNGSSAETGVHRKSYQHRGLGFSIYWLSGGNEGIGKKAENSRGATTGMHSSSIPTNIQSVMVHKLLFAI